MPLSWIAILKVSSFALIEISTLLFSGEYFIALLITILIIIIISFILWHIPFTKNYFIKLYNENSVIHFIINLFLNLFN